MSEPNGQSDGDKAISQLAKMKEELKSNGYGSIAELVSALQKETAEREKAETARDKFNGNNDEAQNIIRSKAGEIGALKQEIEQKDEEIETLKTQLNEAGKTPATPAAPTAESIEEVEAAITEEQWTQGDKLLELMTDDEAKLVDQNPAVRLKFLQSLRDSGPAVPTERPKSLRKKPTEKDTKPSDDELFKSVLSRISGASPLPGPGGPSRQGSRGQGAPQRPEANWLN